MKKLRVFQKVNQRKTVQVFPKGGTGTVFLLFLFLPCLISFLFGNGHKEDEASALVTHLQTGNIPVVNQTMLGREEIPLEIYVADKLARCMDEAYEIEALKAQAVLIRTNLIKEGGESIYVEDDLYGDKEIPLSCYQAAAETKGLILEYKGKPVYAPYFKSSSGYTREAKESLPGEEHSYLTGVPCGKDYLACGYHTTVIYGKETFEDLWKQLMKLPKKEQKEEDFTCIRDSAGYVLEMNYGGEWAVGEEIRYLYHLPSADFRVFWEGREIVFEVTGQGHGFGMSQFTANEMAKEGQDFLAILNYFFKETELTKIER